MATPSERNDADQRPNMWEELNRPKSDHGAPAAPPVTGTPDLPTVAKKPGNHGEAAMADRIDPQHLLLAGAVLFAGVTVFALIGLGGSSNETASERVEAAPTALAAADASIEADVTTTEPPVDTTVETPRTSEAAETMAMAMGLPASLLDSEQSQVFRLYRTALGREPDRSGFEFWSDQVRAGTPLEQLADEFLASEEYQAQFTNGIEWDDRAERLLTNAFGPAASQSDLDDWRSRFAGIDGAELLLAISEADETLAATGTLR